MHSNSLLATVVVLSHILPCTTFPFASPYQTHMVISGEVLDEQYNTLGHPDAVKGVKILLISRP